MLILIFLILGKGTSYWSDDEYEDDYDESDNGLIPESFPLDLDGSLGGISGLPSHIEFQVKYQYKCNKYTYFFMKTAI